MKKFTFLIILSQFVVFTTFNNSYCYCTNNNSVDRNVQQENENTLEFIGSFDIKTVKICRLGFELSEPIAEIGGSEKLLLSFDDISDSPGSYSYSLTHCDSEWKRSDLFFNDFVEGFEINEVKDFFYSSGTIFPYMHFRIEIPNKDLKIKISGNYLLRVFSSYEPEKTLIQRRFVIYEPLVPISATVRQPSTGEHRESGQQLELKINIQPIKVYDPLTEIKTVVCQNYPFRGCVLEAKPTFVSGKELEFTQSDALIFNGGNEFRLFNTKNIRYLSQGMQSVDYIGGEFHIQLKPEESRRKQKYSSYADLNGNYVVILDNSEQSQIEADYVWTYFTLKVPMELDEGKSVYLFGELTGWQPSPDNRMNYSLERGAYEIRLLLKQGAYSYQYIVADNKTGDVDATHFEGSYFDTENNYMVLVYFKSIGLRYERVVGYKKIDSRNHL